jgi:transposase-like protein
MRFRGKDEIKKHLSAQRASGMSIAAYCRQESICENTFYNWRKRFPEPQDTTPAISFLKLPIVPPSASLLELTLPNGARISAPTSFAVDALREVVRVLAPLRPRG